MANMQSISRQWEIHRVELQDEFIELAELDYEDLPPTDPVGRPAWPPTSNYIDFDDDRTHDATPPPMVGTISAPEAERFENSPDAFDSRRTNSLFLWATPLATALVAALATAVLGIGVLRAADNPELQLARTFAQPVADVGATQSYAGIDVPSFTPEDFPFFDESEDEDVKYVWIDLTTAPREDLPAMRRPASEPPTVRDESLPEVDMAAPVVARPDPFNRHEASVALRAAAIAAQACRADGSAPGIANVAVTFAPSGRVTTALISGHFAGTRTGGCIARAFRSAQVSPFAGGLVTVRKTIPIR